MKKWFAFMEWGIFALRAYHYLMLAIQLAAQASFSVSFALEAIWLVAAFIVPILFWLPGKKVQPTAFVITELLLGGSYSLYSIAHPTLAANVDYLLPSLTIGYMLTRRNIWSLAIVFSMPFVAMPLHEVSWSLALRQSTDNLLFAFIGIWVGYIANAYREKNQLMQEVEQQNEQLRQLAEQIARMTRSEERHRLSGELHDALGHSYISLIMGLDVSIALLERDPEQAKQRLHSLRTLAEQQLEQMRDFVHGMAEEREEHWDEQLSTLLQQFREHTGTVTHLHHSGSLYGLSPDIGHTLIRVIQESLTNALKHGKATEITVHLNVHTAIPSAKLLTIRIHNNGNAGGHIAYGFGLTSMQQQLEALGGQLDIQSHPQIGTTVHVTIPWKGVE